MKLGLGREYCLRQQKGLRFLGLRVLLRFYYLMIVGIGLRILMLELGMQVGSKSLKGFTFGFLVFHYMHCKGLEAYRRLL